jgi:hypothetical protein
MREKYLGKTIEAHSKIGGFLIAKGKVIDILGANMLYIVDGSGVETAVTICDTVEIKIVA